MITIQHKSGDRIHLPSLDESEAPRLLPALASGWGLMRPGRPDDLVPIAAPTVTKAARNKDTDEEIAGRLRSYLGTNPGPVGVKAACAALGITGPEFSRAKAQLVKAGQASDPKKGWIARAAGDKGAA